MFTIKHIQDPKQNVDFLELKNSDNSSYAKIDLNFGGSLLELKLLDKTIISSENVIRSKHAFNSSILFPFVNRMEKGSFEYNGNHYSFPINEPDRNNALHGFVFDKHFNFAGQKIEDKKVKATLLYIETQPIDGFPFKYNLKLEYVLTEKEMQLNVEILNEDKQEFPFNLGWHPYFKTKDLSNSFLKITSHKKLLVNDKMIPNGEKQIDWNGFLKIEDKAFDDCFILDSNSVEFKTPEYHLELLLSSEENYLQLYTPNSRKYIAIEPQTAPANSFNSKMGLKILKPNEKYSLNWKINLK